MLLTFLCRKISVQFRATTIAKVSAERFPTLIDTLNTQHRDSHELGSHQGDRPSSEIEEGEKIQTADSEHTNHLLGSVQGPEVVIESQVSASEVQKSVTSNVKNNENEKFC